jgi:glycosyltransferase involved in cell wall biosynthesis
MSSSRDPAVTVVMPVFNGGAFLRPAMESVLGQTFRDFELLVVDDGSTDGSPDVARSSGDSRVRVIENGRNLGLTATLNFALGAARAELVARQDADDLSDPGRLESQVRALAAAPDVVLLGTQAAMIDAAGRYAGYLARACEHDTVVWELLFDNAFVHSSVILRRGPVLEELGGYDEAFRYCQDFDLWSRVVRVARAANLSHRFVRCRSHPSSMTSRGGEANARESEAVIGRNLRAAFGTEITAEEVTLVAKLRRGELGEGIDGFLDVFERLVQLFQDRHPQVKMSADFHRSVARQLSVALRLNRFRSASVLRRILRMERQGYPVLREAVRYLASWMRARASSATDR